MAGKLEKAPNKLGTAPVFLTAISTILGAVMFLRFGYAVGNIGYVGTLWIIAIGHLVTIPTALALAEIATNQKVEGGGEYYIISRSFGINIGAAIGVALFLSQAISAAFYVIAFAEAFGPVLVYIQETFGWIIDKRMVSIPAVLLLSLLMLTKGVDMGVSVLYVVFGILFVSLVMFFLGDSGYTGETSLIASAPNGDGFFMVFAIVFPAFTGMTAGVGLSGDLKDPKKSIPWGTMAATLIGMVVYVFIALKLRMSASIEDLATDQLVMSKIAFWGPIIPIGLAAATISSALGSMMVAPRTLQALAGDKIFWVESSNQWVSKSSTKGEPKNATMLTCIIAFIFVSIGDVNFVAKIISMFFMVTYGAICLISFLNHFAADPSYRPSFKSKWYFSLIGAIVCIALMFVMNPGYAVLAILLMVIIYIGISKGRGGVEGMARIFQGVIFQLSRNLQVFLQKADKDSTSWRPSVICISPDFFQRPSAFDMMKWISYRYGFGTYIHFIKGYFSKESHLMAKDELSRLIKITGSTDSNVFMDTMISPSYTSAVAQSLQLPSVSGQEMNMLLFEYAENDQLTEILDNFHLAKSAGVDICILKSTEKGFGFNSEIHIWITPTDFENANLMILLGYVLMGHPQWKNAEIKIFAIFPKEQADVQKVKLLDLIKTGRLPISGKNVQVISREGDQQNHEIIENYSRDADLTVVGFRSEVIKQIGSKHFNQLENIGNILFVNSYKGKVIN